MADPVSLVSLILDIAPKVIKYITKVIEAQQRLRDIRNEITYATGILYTLKRLHEAELAVQERSHSVSSLMLLKDPLDRYRSILDKIAATVEPKHRLQSVLRAVRWPFTEAATKELWNQIQECKSDFVLALQVDNKDSMQILLRNDLERKERLDKILRSQDELLGMQEEQELRAVMAWLSTIDYDKKHRNAQEIRYPGTGEWILQDLSFLAWHAGDVRSLLCSAIPGAGKTVLASVIIDYLAEQPGENEVIGLAFLYCDHKANINQKLSDLLSILLKQLAFRNAIILEKLREARRNAERDLSRELSSDQVQMILTEAVQEFHRIYIVVDALDECEESDGTRKGLTDFLSHLQKAHSGLSILITSRPSQIASHRLPGTRELQFVAKDSDIKTYLELRLQSEELLQRHIAVQPELRGEVVTKITHKSEGMFLLARLHMDSVAKARTEDDLEQDLYNLPRGREGLDQRYAEALDRMRSQDQRDWERAQRILMWLSFSMRHLRVQELQHALAINLAVSDKNLNRKRILLEEDIPRLCAGLVVIDQESQEVRFVHYSTEEFFTLQREELFPEAFYILFTSCIEYLSFDCFSKRCRSKAEMESMNAAFPLLGYAADNLGRHARRFEDKLKEESLIHEQVTKRVVDLFNKNLNLDCLNQARKKAMDLEYMKGIGFEMPAIDHQPRLMPPLDTAIQYRLLRVVKYFLDNGADINEVSHNGCISAHTAAYEGYTEVLDILVNRKEIDLYHRDMIGNTPLHPASSRGLRRIVRKMLEKQCGLVNIANRHGNTALHDAIPLNKKKVVKCLIDWKADLDLANNDQQLPLDLAVKYDCKEIVQMLRDAKADSSKCPQP